METNRKRAAKTPLRYISDGEDQEFQVGPAGKRVKKEKPKTAICKICHKRFTDRGCLKRHMELHTDSMDFTCEICDSSFKTLKYLHRHHKQVHAPRNHECDVCGKRFPMPHKLEQHKLIHTGEKPHKCEVCGKTFRAKYSLSTHQLLHTNEKPYKCQYCPYACRDSSTLRKHHDRHTGTLKWYQCTHCDKKYYSKRLLKDHIAQRHLSEDLKVVPCTRCPQKFKTAAAMNKHVREVHERALRAKCEICGQELTNRNNMAAHMRVHIQHRPYRCRHSKCGSRFKDMGALRKHSLIHSPSKQHPCEVCGKLFARKHRLLAHMRRHSDTKLKVMYCDYCGFSYDSKPCLVRHMLKHIRHKKTYVCDVCKFVTHRKISIEKHMQYGHGDEDDRYCKICDKSYKLHAYLILHYYNRHGIRYKTVKNIKLETSVSVKQEPLEPVPDAEVDLEELQKQETLADMITEVAFDRSSVELTPRWVRDSGTGFRRRLKGRAGIIDENTLYARKERDIRKKIKKVLERARHKRWSRVLEKARRRYNKRIKAMAARKVAKDNVKVKLANINRNKNDLLKNTDQNDNESEDIEDKTENMNTIANVYEENESKLGNDENICDNDGHPYVTDDETERDDDITDSETIESLSHATNRVTNVYEDLIDIEENPVGYDESDGLKRDGNIYDEDGCSSEKAIDIYYNNIENKQSQVNNNREDNNKQTKEDVDNCVINNRVINNVKEINVNNSGIDVTNEEFSTENDNIDAETENGQSKKNYDSMLLDGVNKNLDVNNADAVSGKEKDDRCKREKDANVKLKINSHQCYICYKLYETGEKLLEHCQEHFDVCSDVALKKCPICNYVTKRQITRHLKVEHNLNITLPYKINDNSEHTEEKSRYYYNLDDEVIKEIEVIPSVKNLNKIAYVKIDVNNKKCKDSSVARTKLVKKSKGWVVESENVNVNNEYILPKFDAKEMKRVKVFGEGYLDVIKILGRLAKRHNTKMLFPCNGCEKLCQTYAALKLHSRKHETDPKPFKTKVWKHKLGRVKKDETSNNREQVTHIARDTKPKPILNKHKCDKKLMEFYEKNVKGAGIEFWQFLKIYNKMNRDFDNIENLKETNQFGDYITGDNLSNGRAGSSVLNVNGDELQNRRVIKKFRRRIMLSKEERMRRAEIREQMRKNITQK